MQEEKLLASGKGIGVYISLVEPVLFLRGFEGQTEPGQNAVVLRGVLHLHVTKPTKIRAVTLALQGKAVTTWPEGIPPRKVKSEESRTVISYAWTLLHPQTKTISTMTHTDHIGLFERFPLAAQARESLLGCCIYGASKSLSPSKRYRLARSVNFLRGSSKDESANEENSMAQRGYMVFEPGNYIYKFELPLNSTLPETLVAKSGSVHYELNAIVQRAGLFCADLAGSRDVALIRTPAEDSLEQFEPIAIDRNWKDEVHVEITVSGKSFPLGAQIPIWCRLTTQANVQFHWIKVFATEHTEYYCSDKRVHRMEPVRKIQLFERWGDFLPTSVISGDTKTAVSGTVYMSDQNSVASKMHSEEATLLASGLSGDAGHPVTEMDILAQLSSRHNTNDANKSSQLHSDSTYENIRVHHWIKILIRLSRSDLTDPTGRKSFEITVNAPLRILSRQVTQAATTLPAYSVS